MCYGMLDTVVSEKGLPSDHAFGCGLFERDDISQVEV